MSFRNGAIAAVCVIVGVPVTAHAQWTETILNPAGSSSAQAIGSFGDQQVGDVNGGAALWNGTAGSYVNLNPAGVTYGSLAGASSGTHQVGEAVYGNGGTPNAALWSGTAASYVNLNPVGSSQSAAGAISGNQEVGYATISSDLFGPTSAAMWNGTAASFVNLNPAGVNTSYASWVSGNQQVGAWTNNGIWFAALWSGTAASFVNLNPAGASTSYAGATDGALQIGAAEFGGKYSAGYWSGTAASWVALPDQFGYSVATSISVVGNTTYITGIGGSDIQHRDHAILWTYTPAVPEPAPIAALGVGVLGLMLRKRRSGYEGRKEKNQEIAK